MQTPQATATDTTPAHAAVQPATAAATTPRTCPLRRIHMPPVYALRYKRHALQVIIYAVVVAAYVMQIQQLDVIQNEVEKQTAALDDLEQRFSAMGERAAIQEPTSCNRTRHMLMVARQSL